MHGSITTYDPGRRGADVYALDADDVAAIVDALGARHDRPPAHVRRLLAILSADQLTTRPGYAARSN